MLTREQIAEIQTEHLVKGASIKILLKQRGISASRYFWWKRKYSKPDVPEGFLPLSGGGLPAPMSERLYETAPSSGGKSRADSAGENWMRVELRPAVAQAQAPGVLPTIPLHSRRDKRAIDIIKRASVIL